MVIVGRDRVKAQARLDRVLKDNGKAEFFSCDTTSKAALEKLLADVVAKYCVVRTSS